VQHACRCSLISPIADIWRFEIYVRRQRDYHSGSELRPSNNFACTKSVVKSGCFLYQDALTYDIVSQKNTGNAGSCQFWLPLPPRSTASTPILHPARLLRAIWLRSTAKRRKRLALILATSLQPRSKRSTHPRAPWGSRASMPKRTANNDRQLSIAPDVHEVCPESLQNKL
jgi:hypothetical protein